MRWCFCCSVRVGFWDSCLLVLVGVVLGLWLFWFGLWFVGWVVFSRFGVAVLGLCFGLPCLWVWFFLVCVSAAPAGSCGCFPVVLLAGGFSLANTELLVWRVFYWFASCVGLFGIG